MIMQISKTNGSTTSLLSALDAFRLPPSSFMVVDTQEMQQLNYNASPKPQATGTRGTVKQWAQPYRLLTWQEVFPTPTHVRARISLQQVAFWQLAGQQVWAVSTLNHTVLLRSSSAMLVDLVTVRPAKGGGEMRLYVGQLALYDVYHSEALRQLAAAIEGSTGIIIRRSESYDC